MLFENSLKISPLLWVLLAVLCQPLAAQLNTEEDAVAEEVVVLGSHIRARNVAGANFAESLSEDEWSFYNPHDTTESVGDFLMPLQGRLAADTFLYPGSDYLTGLNMHGLGAGKTLVMVDGYRLGEVPGNLPGWKDAASSIGDLPASILAGIQVLPAGASSLYGSGALGGVVNLVTKDPFNGVEVEFINVDSEGTQQQQRTSLTFGVGGRYINFVLAWEERADPRLRARSRPWAVEFQQNNPEYFLSENSGSPGTISFSGQMVDLLSLAPHQSLLVSSCLQETDEAGEIISEVLCGDDAVQYTATVPLEDLVIGGGQSLVVPDLFCQEQGGTVSGEKCLQNNGDALLLRQHNESQRIFMGYAHELADGAEMRVQYSYRSSSVPTVQGVAQKTPLNSKWSEWDVPTHNLGIVPFLLQTLEDGTAVSNVLFPQLLLLEDMLALGLVPAPDTDFFLSGLDNPSIATTEEVDAANGWADLVEDVLDQNLNLGVPSWSSLLQNTGADASLTYTGNILGSTGAAVYGSRDYRRQRFGWQMDGHLGVSEFAYRAGVVYESARTSVVERDLVVQNLERALRGYGSPTCPYETAVENDRLAAAGVQISEFAAQAGGGGCYYLFPLGGGLVAWDDPTISTITGLPSSEPLSGNLFGAYLLNWLFASHELRREQQSLQGDFVIEGSSKDRRMAWVAGTEYRRNVFALEPIGYADASAYPCAEVLPAASGEVPPFGGDVCAAPVGPFAHLPSVLPRQQSRDVLSFFGEIQLYMRNLQLQLSGRLELESESGAQFAPGISFGWQLTPALRLMSSAGSSFRLPSLAQQVDVTAEAVYVDVLKNYLLVQSTSASSDLQEESARHLDLGLYLSSGAFSLWARYWMYWMSDSIVQDSPHQIINACLGDGEIICTDTLFDAVQMRLLSQGEGLSPETLSSGLQLGWQNGPEIKTGGLDLHAGYGFHVGPMWMSLALDVSALRQYEVGSYYLDGELLVSGFDAAGLYNDGYAFGSLPEMQVSWQYGLRLNQHELRMRYLQMGSYHDQRYDAQIDAFNRLDLHYSWLLPSRRVKLRVDISNVGDEDPPEVKTPLGYDASQHSPYGRTLQLGFSLNYP